MKPQSTDLQAVADFLDPQDVGHLPDPDTCQRVGKFLKHLLATSAAPAYALCDGDHGAPRCSDPQCWLDDAPAAAVYERRLRAVLTVVQRYLPPDGILAHDAMTEIIGLVDPWPADLFTSGAPDPDRAAIAVCPAISRETIAEWRALQGQGMTSAVGEYTPAEFWTLLDAYEALASGVPGTFNDHQEKP